MIEPEDFIESTTMRALEAEKVARRVLRLMSRGERVLISDHCPEGVDPTEVKNAIRDIVMRR